MMVAEASSIFPLLLGLHELNANRKPEYGSGCILALWSAGI